MRNPLRIGEPKKGYKLRDKTTGLYSNGGSYGGFGPDGKTWDSIKNLKSHLRLRYSQRWDQATGTYPLVIPDNLEVVEGVFQPVGQSIGLAKDVCK